MRAAVLIIGSLLWDTDDSRVWWRQRHLDTRNEVEVSAPIRYGRQSSSRANTYTMTIDREVANGTARLVPIRQKIGGAADLIAQATALWRAEHRQATAGAISARWGCVGAAFRPNQANAESLAIEWSAFFAGESPPRPIDSRGLLNIDWPRLTSDGTRAEFDMILATATRATPGESTPRRMAKAWLRQAEGHESYFFNNVRCGIRTPEDRAIWSIVKEVAPGWINDRKYARAIEILDGEGTSKNGGLGGA